MRNILLFAATMLASLAFAAPVTARVHEQTENSFVIRLSVEVKETPEASWDTLIRPSQWWNPARTFSQDADNLSLHPRAGGCFCEILPNPESPTAAPRGSVEHMRVVYAEDARALRMTGVLGPMQSEALTGVLTIFLKPIDGGTRILWEYVVSGKLRKKGMASAVDVMLAEQILRLAEQLGSASVAGWSADDLGGSGDDAVAGDEPVDETIMEEAPVPDGDTAAGDMRADGLAGEAVQDSDDFDQVGPKLPDTEQAPDPFTGR